MRKDWPKYSYLGLYLWLKGDSSPLAALVLAFEAGTWRPL
jgi:hypothetical protein